MLYRFKKVGIDFVKFIACPWHCCSPPSNLDAYFITQKIAILDHHIPQIVTSSLVSGIISTLLSSDLDLEECNIILSSAHSFCSDLLSEHKVACQDCMETRLMVWRVQDLFLMLQSKASDWQLCKNEIEESNVSAHVENISNLLDCLVKLCLETWWSKQYLYEQQ